MLAASHHSFAEVALPHNGHMRPYEHEGEHVFQSRYKYIFHTISEKCSRGNVNKQYSNHRKRIIRLSNRSEASSPYICYLGTRIRTHRFSETYMQQRFHWSVEMWRSSTCTDEVGSSRLDIAMLSAHPIAINSIHVENGLLRKLMGSKSISSSTAILVPEKHMPLQRAAISICLLI